MQSQEMLKSHSLRSICGPFDREFTRKFLGRRSTSLFSQRKNLLKLPAPMPVSTTSIDLLPKIKQIEKISKSSGKKLPRHSKQGGVVVSDLELYLAKKMISNQSTKQLISKIEEHTHRGEGKWVNQGNKMKHSQTQSNFYTPSPISSPVILPNQTTYSPFKKWISDDEFRTKFDRFIIKPVQTEMVKINDLLGAEKKEDSEQLIGKLGTDKLALKQIVKKMIEDNQHDSQPEDIMEHSGSLRSKKTSKNQKSQNEQRGIRWILQKCEDFQRKFKPRKPKP